MDLTHTRPQIRGRPMTVRKRKTVGIDLGTTNTVLARNFETLPIEGGGSVMPSAVAFPPSGAKLVGKVARRRRAMDPRNTILSAKRIIGARWRSSYTTQFREHYPYDLVEGPDGWAVFNTRAGLVCPVEVGSNVARVCNHFCTGADDRDWSECASSSSPNCEVEAGKTARLKQITADCNELMDRLIEQRGLPAAAAKRTLPAVKLVCGGT